MGLLHTERQHQTLTYRTRGRSIWKAYGYVDDRRCRPAALPERARKAGKCSPSPTYPQAPLTTDLIIDEVNSRGGNQPSRRRPEPASKLTGLHLKKQLRLSHKRGPPQFSRRRRAFSAARSAGDGSGACVMGRLADPVASPLRRTTQRRSTVSFSPSSAPTLATGRPLLATQTPDMGILFLIQPIRILL